MNFDEINMWFEEGYSLWKKIYCPKNVRTKIHDKP